MSELGLSLPKSRPRGTPHRVRMAQLLKAYRDAGMSLAACGDAKRLGRAQSTLKQYARDLGLSFPDYMPRKLRRKKRR